jgi:hypothetical protein
MNIISTYREVLTYRGAAELCGTTHKPVRRAVERAEAGGPPAREPRPRNFDAVRDLVAERRRVVPHAPRPTQARRPPLN